jgi:heme-degrading monooxygenase HmoA
MIERHIPFTVEHDHQAEFETFFEEEYRPAAERSDGLIAIALLRVQDDPTTYRMTFRWTDGDSAAAWRVSLAHEALQPTLHRIASMGDITVFDVVG